jgi:hypothetical protein
MEFNCVWLTLILSVNLIRNILKNRTRLPVAGRDDAENRDWRGLKTNPSPKGRDLGRGVISSP